MDTVKEALEFYASEWRRERGTLNPAFEYPVPSEALKDDGGDRARAALEVLKK